MTKKTIGGLIGGVIATLAGMAVGAWMDRNKEEPDVVETDCEEISVVEAEVVEEVTES